MKDSHFCLAFYCHRIFFSKNMELGSGHQFFLGPALVLGHFLVGRVFQLLGLVVMWGHLKQPLVLDLYDVPHELLGGEHQLMVDDPPEK